MQAALQIANAASTNAYDDQYPSPYTVEAVRQGMDLPWWQKLLGARFKDGKFQLARLQVCATSTLSACVACLVPGGSSMQSAWSAPIGDHSAACTTCGSSTVQLQFIPVTEHPFGRVQRLPSMLSRRQGSLALVGMYTQECAHRNCFSLA